MATEDRRRLSSAGRTMYGARLSGTQTTDGPDRDEIDPYEIVPDDFTEAYGAETIPEALAKAERARSSTDYDTVRRCPECYSAKVVSKSGWTESPIEKPGQLKCDVCFSHFTHPAPCVNTVREHVLEELERGAAHGAAVAASLHDLGDELVDGLSVLR